MKEGLYNIFSSIWAENVSFLKLNINIDSKFLIL